MANSDHAHGLVMAHINRGPFLNHVVAIPPLAEQHRIVARVDALMGLLDRLEAANTIRDTLRCAARDAALNALRNAPDAETVEGTWSLLSHQMDALFTTPEDIAPLRQTILQLAVRGQIINHTPSIVPLADLLSEPLANGRSVPDGTGYPVLRLTALRGAQVDPSLCKAGSWTADEGRRFQIRAGDILVVRGNGSKELVARGSMVAESAEVAFPDTAIRIRPNLNRITQRYLFLVWNSPQTRSNLEAKSKTTAGIWKVSQSDLYDICLPVPPLNVQDLIVAKVDALMALCDQLEARLQATQALQSQLAAAAVHHLDL
jgi:type I restriction enzyme S subunit